MSDRPEILAARLHSLDQIGQVVGALRAIAAGHQAEAERALAPIRAHAETIRRALARIAAPPATAARGGPGLALVVGAAQGFSGAYPYRLADAAAAAAAEGAGLLVTGRRSLTLLAERQVPVLWSAEMAAHPAEIPDLASRITDRLLGLAPDHPGPVRLILDADGQGAAVETRQIVPADLGTGTGGREPPLTTLPLPRLIEGLLDEAMFSAVALGLTQGLLAESAARVAAMARAQSHLGDRRAETLRAFREARQEAMTTELLELTAARRRPATGDPA